MNRVGTELQAPPLCAQSLHKVVSIRNLVELGSVPPRVLVLVIVLVARNR